MDMKKLLKHKQPKPMTHHREIRPAPSADLPDRSNTSMSASSSPTTPTFSTLSTANVPSPQRVFPRSTVEQDGYKILRNAVPLSLAREVSGVIDNGLPKNNVGDTHMTFVTPIQAYVLRDEFVKVYPYLPMTIRDSSN